MSAISQVVTAVGLTAAGNASQSGGLALSGAAFQQFSTVGATTNSATLPKPVNGQRITIRNDGANPLNVYPAVGGTIDGQAANAAQVVLAGSSIELTSKDGNAWSSLLVQPYNSSGIPSGAVVAGGATRAITAADAATGPGSFISVSAAAARVYTLPAVAGAAGLKFRFVVTTGGANTVTITAPSAILNGQVLYGAGAPTAATGLNASASTNLIFAASQVIGAWAEVWSDGTNYYVAGQSTIASGFTVS